MSENYSEYNECNISTEILWSSHGGSGENILNYNGKYLSSSNKIFGTKNNFPYVRRPLSVYLLNKYLNQAETENVLIAHKTKIVS